MTFLKINVHIEFPDDTKRMQIIAADLLASILIRKLEAKDISKFIEMLKDDFNKINW